MALDSGERRVVSSVVLEAEDPDSPPDQVHYFLNAEPRFGKLQLKVRVQIRASRGRTYFLIRRDDEDAFSVNNLTFLVARTSHSHKHRQYNDLFQQQRSCAGR